MKPKNTKNNIKAAAIKANEAALATASTQQELKVSEIPEHIGRFDGLALNLRDNITFADWKAVGVGFARVHNGSGWALGDWLNAGARFEKDGTTKKAYKEAVEATGIDYGRLRTFASIAARFKPEERRVSLSFEHHRLLAPVKGDKVIALMDKAENEKLSAAALRAIVPKSGKTKKKKETDEQRKVRESREDEKWREKAQLLKEYLEDMPPHCMHLWRKLCEEIVEACQGVTGRFSDHEANAAAEAERDAAAAEDAQ